MTQKIKATREGVSREFSLSVWNMLPASKYGWKPATEPPPEVKAKQAENKAAVLSQGTTDSEYAEKLKAARKKVQDADAKYAAALQKGDEKATAKALDTKEKAEAELKSLLIAEKETGPTE